MLVGLDTGAFSNLLSVRAGRQVSKVNSEDRVRIHGVNGAAAAQRRVEKPVFESGNGSSGSKNCCTIASQNAMKRTKTTRQRLYLLYLITTYARFGVIS